MQQMGGSSGDTDSALQRRNQRRFPAEPHRDCCHRTQTPAEKQTVRTGCLPLSWHPENSATQAEAYGHMPGVRPERHREGRHAGRTQSHHPRAGAGEQGRDAKSKGETFSCCWHQKVLSAYDSEEDATLSENLLVQT